MNSEDNQAAAKGSKNTLGYLGEFSKFQAALLWLIHLEGIIYNVCDFCYPFALDIHLLMVLLNRIKVGCAKQAEAYAGLFIIEQIHMGNAEFISRGLAKFFEIFFSKRNLVNIEKYRHTSGNATQSNIVIV